MKEFLSKSTQDTSRLAKKFSKILTKGDVVGFSGQLGAGKTTFIKAIAKNLGVKDEVTSSSFVILRQYEGKITIFHIDLYRLSLKQIPDDVYDCMYPAKGLALIEWADKIKLPKNNFSVEIELTSLSCRRIKIKAASRSSHQRLKKL